MENCGEEAPPRGSSIRKSIFVISKQSVNHPSCIPFSNHDNPSPTMKKHLLTSSLPLVPLALALAACGPVVPPIAEGECPDVPPPQVAPNTTTPVTGEAYSVDLAACSGAVPQTQIDKELAITRFLENDFHEMVVCGGLANQFAYDLVHFFADLGCGKPADPTGVIFSGLGTFLAGAVMTINVKLAKDSDLGKAGDPVPFNPFDISSYGSGITVRATITADTSWNTNGDYAAHVDGTYEIEVSDPNPGALALWGIVTTGKVQKNQAELLKALAENVVFNVDISQESSQGTKYRVVSPDISVGDLYGGKELDMPLTFLQANIADTGQLATLGNWAIKFTPDGPGILDGSIGVRVDGGMVPFYVTYTYPHTATPNIAVTCMAPAP